MTQPRNLSLRDISFVFSMLAFNLLLSCAGRNHLTHEYQKTLSSADRFGSGRTVVVILIDGLPVTTLRQALDQHQVPHIWRFFRGHQKQLSLARTSFPSLTFPGIGALLTEVPVEQNGFFGNVIVQDDESINFESPFKYPELNQMVEGRNVYSRLSSRGYKSVSVEYGFYADSRAHMESPDTQAALAIQQKDYEAVDAKLANSAVRLLTETEIALWPDFVFVHLIGVDLTSHDHGPNSGEVRRYLKFLDRQLAPLFAVLERADATKQRKILGMLTSDHGFDKKVSVVFELKKIIKRLDSKIRVLNEGRYLGLYFPPAWKPEKAKVLMDELVGNSRIDIVGIRLGEEIQLQSKEFKSQISYRPGSCRKGNFQISVSNSEFKCPDDLSSADSNRYYPFFLSNISRYFQTPNSPDAVIIGRSGVSFNRGVIGIHGGPTPQETIVPLLLRNCRLADPSSIPVLSDLLSFL